MSEKIAWARGRREYYASLHEQGLVDMFDALLRFLTFTIPEEM